MYKFKSTKLINWLFNELEGINLFYWSKLWTKIFTYKELKDRTVIERQ
jgi:hypothetical protein